MGFTKKRILLLAHLLYFDEYDNSVTSPKPSANEVHITPTTAVTFICANATNKKLIVCNATTNDMRILVIINGKKKTNKIN